jgi:hypothetical protein
VAVEVGEQLDRSFVAGFCIYNANPTDECSQGDLRYTGWRLAKLYWEAAKRKAISNILKVRFPVYASRYQQLRYLKRLELRAISQVATLLRHDVSTLTPFNWRVEDNRIVNQWVVGGVRRINGGSNWTHDWALNAHTFNPGAANNQAINIDLHGWQ